MEFHENDLISLYLQNLAIIEQCHSQHQEIMLLKHPLLGKVLIINGEIQHIEKYQVFYHEMLVHLPIAFIPHLESALIIGGGSLFAAYEVLKYKSLKKIILCDYDHTVLDVMCRHYKHAKDVMSDPRFTYIEEEGSQYILNETTQYDLIVNDCFNLAALSGSKGDSYFEMLSKINTSHGVCVDIIYRHIFDKKTTIDTLNYLLDQENIVLSLVAVPEYPGILHLETVWGKSPNIHQSLMYPINDIQKDVINNVESMQYYYYNPRNLAFYLYLPPYIKELFSL